MYFGTIIIFVILCGFDYFSPLFMEDVSSVWNFEHSVEQYTATGGTALSSVNTQIATAEDFLRTFALIPEESH